MAPAPSPSATQNARRTRVAALPAARRAWLLEPLAPFRRPAPTLMIFTSGLAAACSTRPESFSTLPTTSLAEIKHAVDPVELAVGPLHRPLDLAQQRHGLLAHRVDRHLRALEHAERVEQHDAAGTGPAGPRAGQDDEGGVAAVKPGASSILDPLRRVVGSVRVDGTSPRSIPSGRARVPTSVCPGLAPSRLDLRPRPTARSTGVPGTGPGRYSCPPDAPGSRGGTR